MSVLQKLTHTVRELRIFIYDENPGVAVARFDRCVHSLLPPSMRRDGAGWFADFLEQKSERRTNQADQHTETKTVDVAEQRALLLKNAVENGGRFLDRTPVAGRVRERALDVRDLSL